MNEPIFFSDLPKSDFPIKVEERLFEPLMQVYSHSKTNPSQNVAIDYMLRHPPPQLKGELGLSPPGNNLLQRHCAYFDRNQDGVIMPWETYAGLRDLGYSLPMTLFAVCVIHISLSYPSLDSWAPDPFFGIELRNIHQCKHGSDTGIIDHFGNMDVDRWETIFGSLKEGGVLKLFDVWNLTNATRMAWDFFGWFGAKLEWVLLYLLATPNGLTKEQILGCYDGSLFIQRQHEYTSS